MANACEPTQGQHDKIEGGLTVTPLLREDCEHFNFGKTFSNITYFSDDRRIQLKQFLAALKESVAKRFAIPQSSYVSMAYIIVRLEYGLTSGTKRFEVYLQTTRRILESATFASTFTMFEEEIMLRHEVSLRSAPNLEMRKVQEARISIARCELLQKATFTRVPQYIERKKAMINVVNEDNRIFGYALISCFESQNKFFGSSEIECDRHFIKYKLDTLQYPVELCDIGGIEQRIKVAINVYGYYDDKSHKRYPIYISDHKFDTQIDLFYWEGRYAWIKNFSRFMSGATSTNQGKRVHCRRCLQGFKSESTQAKHLPFCKGLMKKHHPHQYD